MRIPPYDLNSYFSFSLKPECTVSFPASFFVLRTCQRLEIFGWSPDHNPQLAAQLHPFVLSSTSGLFCLQRLIELCCGAESQLLGETEVFGQIKESYQQQKESLSRPLHWLIQSSFWGAKSLRTHAPIRSGPASYGGWVRRYLSTHPLYKDPTCAVLFIGGGKMIHEIAHFIAPQLGASRLHWMNRTLDNVRPLQERHGGEIESFCAHHFTEHSLIICAIHLEEHPENWAQGWNRWHDCWGTSGLTIDLSSPSVVPSNLHPSPSLITLTDLQHLSAEELKHRQQQQIALRSTIRQWIERRWHLPQETQLAL